MTTQPPEGVAQPVMRRGSETGESLQATGHKSSDHPPIEGKAIERLEEDLNCFRADHFCMVAKHDLRAVLDRLRILEGGGIQGSLRPQEGPSHPAADGDAWVLVPREPTEAMLQPACSGHVVGQSMGKNYYNGETEPECPRFGTRRRIWASMLAAAPLPTAPTGQG